jgi:hypothetical protein
MSEIDSKMWEQLNTKFDNLVYLISEIVNELKKLNAKAKDGECVWRFNGKEG